MTEGKHTHGPWEFSGSAIHDVNVDRIATVDGKDTWEAMANGRLMAAAPDLLHAAKEARERLKVMAEMTACRSDDDWVWSCQALLDAAILKAEGGK